MTGSPTSPSRAKRTRTQAKLTGRISTERSSDRILTAAAELAKERGVAGATIARVCQRSGLPVSSVYWHFDDKDALFAEVIRTSFAQWLVRVPRWEVGHDGLAEGLRSILGPATSTLGEVPDFMRVGMQVILDTAETNAKAREAYLASRTQTRVMVSTWLRAVLGDSVDAGVADDLSLLTIAFADGLMVASQIFDDVEAEAYVDLFCGMVEQVIE